MFGDWATVLAAYNCGENRVLRTIQSQNINYLDNFWDLYERLPRETARYVPRFLATLHIVQNLPRYGLADVAVDSPQRYETVTIPRQCSLRSVAQATGLDIDLLQELNAELRQGVLPEDGYESARAAGRGRAGRRQGGRDPRLPRAAAGGHGGAAQGAERGHDRNARPEIRQRRKEHPRRQRHAQGGPPSSRGHAAGPRDLPAQPGRSPGGVRQDRLPAEGCRARRPERRYPGRAGEALRHLRRGDPEAEQVGEPDAQGRAEAADRAAARPRRLRPSLQRPSPRPGSMPCATGIPSIRSPADTTCPSSGCSP